MEEEINITFEYFFDAVKSYIEDDNELEVIKKAYEFAERVHTGEKRLTDEDYIMHPLNVAYILTKIHSDYQTLSAALLHDVVEDTNVTFEELEKGFSKNVIEALKLLTHDKKVPYAEYIIKLKDNPIAKKVKLADLKHNSDKTRLENLTPKDIIRNKKYENAISLLSD